MPGWSSAAAASTSRTTRPGDGAALVDDLQRDVAADSRSTAS